VYSWGNVRIVRPLLRALAWAGSLMAVVGVAGLIVTIRDFAVGLGPDRLGGIHPATFLFVYVCFLVLGVAFGVKAWLTRRDTLPLAVEAAGASQGGAEGGRAHRGAGIADGCNVAGDTGLAGGAGDLSEASWFPDRARVSAARSSGLTPLVGGTICPGTAPFT
jgi:hypothetical protein